MEITIRDREHDLVGHLKKWKHDHPDAYIMQQFITAAIAKEEELTSLRAQVEELSKYHEEAVRAVWEDGRGCNELAEYEEHAGTIAAIFKEKQGVGK